VHNDGAWLIFMESDSGFYIFSAQRYFCKSSRGFAPVKNCINHLFINICGGEFLTAAFAKISLLL
jgi:hypothetical protein